MSTDSCFFSVVTGNHFFSLFKLINTSLISVDWNENELNDIVHFPFSVEPTSSDAF